MPIATGVPVADLLSSLDADELRALVNHLIESDPALVDTRKLHSIVPARILDELGIKREYYQRFRREDGFVRQLGIGLAKTGLQGKTSHDYIVFGDDLHEAVVGSMTLTIFALAADPEQGRLVPGILTL